MTYSENVSNTFEGLDGLVNEIESNNLRCIVLASCKSERWLQWTATVLQNFSTLITDYDSILNPSIPFVETDFSFCEGCESVNLTETNPNNISEYRPRTRLSINGKTDSGSEQISDFVNISWNIDDEFVEGSVLFGGPLVFGDVRTEIGTYNLLDTTNDQFFLNKSISVFFRCIDGAFLVDIYSNCSGGGLSPQSYGWENMEIPINSLGLPNGGLSLAIPTNIYDNLTNDELASSNISWKSYEGSGHCEPIIPIINFSYIIYPNNPILENPCSQYNVTTTTTTTTTP